MEIFDKINISNEINSKSEKITDYRYYRHCRRIGDSNEFAKIDHLFPDYNSVKKNINKNYSFQNFNHIPQNELQKILFKNLQKQNPENIHFGHKLLNFKKDPKTKKIQTEILNINKNKKKTTNYDLIIACDGFSSKTRKKALINLDNPKPIMKFLNIHFKSKKLTNYINKNKINAMLHFVYNSNICACLINYSYKKSEFGMHLPLTNSEFENYNKNGISAKKLKSMILEMLVEKFSDIDVDLIYEGVWLMGDCVAESFFENGVVLCGDSAHCFPPSGGFGLNSGIEDVANLIQKLMVLDKNFGEIDYPDLREKKKIGIIVGDGLFNNNEIIKNDLFNCENDEAIFDRDLFNENKETLLNHYSKERLFSINLIRKYAMDNLKKAMKFSSSIGFDKGGLDILENIQQFPFLKSTSFLEKSKKFFTTPLEYINFNIDRSLLIKLNDFDFEFNTKNKAQKNILEKDLFFKGFEEKNKYRGCLFKHLKLKIINQEEEKNERIKNNNKDNNENINKILNEDILEENNEILYSRKLLNYINNEFGDKPFFIFTNLNLEKISENKLFHIIKENSETGNFEIFNLKISFENLKNYYDLINEKEYVIIIRSDDYVENIYVK